MVIKRVLVLGAGSAGFLAALTLKVKVPGLQVTVLRSKDIGIIGVGEGTTGTVPEHLHRYLGIDVGEFWREADPVPKLGIRFVKWGPRPYFDYVFGHQFNYRFLALPKEVGFYCQDEISDASITAAMMQRNRGCFRGREGAPVLPQQFGYHLENQQFVALLERYVNRLGIPIIDDTVSEVTQDEQGIKSLRLASGSSADADLYLDCSGFRSVLLGKALAEPFISYKSTLFCDRAVVGGWDRLPDEPIQPYTVSEIMDSGWAWRIDHPQRINRGYVYSSAFISDEQAEQEFRQKNPKIQKTRVVPFVTGRYRNAWVKNVVGIGNANGFVEPLEATGIGVICAAMQNLAQILSVSDGHVHSTATALFNRYSQIQWEQIRRFLGIHYKLNTRLDTPFWRECREHTDLGGAEQLVEFYYDNGPTALFANVLCEPTDSFGPEGYLSMLLGQQAPTRRQYVPSDAEQAKWQDIRRWIVSQVSQAMPMPEALAAVRNLPPSRPTPLAAAI